MNECIIESMSKVIRIPYIDSYVQDVVDGVLILTPISEDAYCLVKEYRFLGDLSERYEHEMQEYAENNERREMLKEKSKEIHNLKVKIRKRFMKNYDEKLWNKLYNEFII